MRRLLKTAALFACAIQSHALPAAEAPVEVMVLGTYHMGNPGRDLANAKAEDVTTPHRQREIRAVVDQLARWKPTKVLIETQVPAPFTVPRYHEFTPELLATKPNEIWQIGFRLANQLGHKEVYGFDEQNGPGEPEYFQWDRVEKFAQSHGSGKAVTGALNYFKDRAKQFEARQASKSVAELLIDENDVERARGDHGRGYYFALPIGNADDQVGAEFNAFWYMRNAKMFGKIALISEPGDRILVLVGSGHGYWLRHFASETPGFRAADPIPYLKRASSQK